MYVPQCHQKHIPRKLTGIHLAIHHTYGSLNPAILVESCPFLSCLKLIFKQMNGMW